MSPTTVVCLNLLCISTIFGYVRNPRDAATPVYIGCYIDGGPENRLLQGLHQNFPQTLTPDICTNHCFQNGFGYAGTQYSYECFCSKEKPSDDKRSAVRECNAKCAGDESKICGGNNRLSVTSTGVKGTGDDVSLKYIGCYKDFSNGSRLMTGHHQDFPETLSNQLCVNLCRIRGFRYAGMEYGKECFCDNKELSFRDFAKEEDCSKRCDGNILQLCGGNWKISMFDTQIPGSPPSEDAGNHIGCYKDQETPRTLNGHMADFGNTLTPLKCTGLCYSMGFLYAGTQNSNQCFCGDDLPNINLKVSQDECVTPCTGDPTKKCGGDYRNTIRQTGITDISTQGRYLGCFNDINNQILKGLKITFDKTNSPRRCMNYCRQLGYKYSGVEYGKECLCGNEEPSQNLVLSGDECNMACSGKSLETCGAGWRLGVYSTTTNVEPITVQPTTTTRSCQVSVTTVNGRTACSGDVIFEDNFNSSLGSKWKNIVMISETSDNGFAVFHASPKNLYVSQNKLVIKPTIFDNDQTLTGSFELNGCTGDPKGRECGYQAKSYLILPPVASARINTQHSFTFSYGIVEIRAKFPVGDWLIPELWLEPKNHLYGPNYASGRIRLAMCRGNQQLQCHGQDLSSSHLESGIVMGPENDIRSRTVSSTVPSNWHDNFHTYTLIWKPDRISFKIDNEIPQEIMPQDGRLCDVIGFSNDQCTMWASQSKIAPFDTDFYISLGLSPGNAREFPDDCINRGKPKPWKNLELKELLKFYLDKANWSTTWTDDKSALYIEYVRVTAL